MPSTPIEYAITLLSRHPYTEHQIREKLKTRFAGQPLNIDETVARLVELNYINDEDFTDRWIRYRSGGTKKGKFALKSELKRKGIKTSIIERKVHSLDEAPLISSLIESRYPKIKGKDDFDRKRKLMRFLLSRGFEMSAVIDEVEKVTGGR